MAFFTPYLFYNLSTLPSTLSLRSSSHLLLQHPHLNSLLSHRHPQHPPLVLHLLHHLLHLLPHVCGLLPDPLARALRRLKAIIHGFVKEVLVAKAVTPSSSMSSHAPPLLLLLHHLLSFSFFFRMLCSFVLPGKHIFPFLLMACSSIKLMSSAKQVHIHVVKYGFLECDCHVTNGLLHAYACCGFVGDARKMFDEMWMWRNSTIWTTMFSGYVSENAERSWVWYMILI